VPPGVDIAAHQTDRGPIARQRTADVRFHIGRLIIQRPSRALELLDDSRLLVVAQKFRDHLATGHRAAEFAGIVETMHRVLDRGDGGGTGQHNVHYAQNG
jgi:hypothetical protein